MDQNITKIPSEFLTAHPDFLVAILKQCVTDKQRLQLVKLWTRLVVTDTQIALRTAEARSVNELTELALRKSQKDCNMLDAFIVESFGEADTSMLEREDAVAVIVERVHLDYERKEQ